jgi:hypothetical protein
MPKIMMGSIRPACAVSQKLCESINMSINVNNHPKKSIDLNDPQGSAILGDWWWEEEPTME